VLQCAGGRDAAPDTDGCLRVGRHLRPCHAPCAADLCDFPRSKLTFSRVSQAVTTNVDGFIKDVDPTILLVLQASCGLTWLCWLISAAKVATKDKKA